MRKYRKDLWVLFMAMIGSVMMQSGLAAQSPQCRTVPAGAREPRPESPAGGSGRSFRAGVRLALFEEPVPAPAPPKVSFILKDRHGHATPTRTNMAHTGGGNVDVVQPREDTLVFIMTGVVTAGPNPCDGTAAGMAFDLNQDFEIDFADAFTKKAKLTLEAQVVGLLRGDKFGGCASVNSCSVVVVNGKSSVLALALEGHTVNGDDNLAINDRKRPDAVSVPAGDYHLLQTLHISADHARSIRGKAAAAEFAPDPALDPTWISITDPFRGANKKEFGFRVILRVEPE
jgi:hypothetical protein